MPLKWWARFALPTLQIPSKKHSLTGAEVGCPHVLRSAAYGHDGNGFEHAGDAVGEHAAADPDLDHQAERRCRKGGGPDAAGYGQSGPRRWRQPQYCGLKLLDPHGEAA